MVFMIFINHLKIIHFLTFCLPVHFCDF